MATEAEVIRQSSRALGSRWITRQHLAVLSLLQMNIRDVLKRELQGAHNCALLGFPDHPNVGDSMIWLGELALLRELGVKVRYVCTELNYSADDLRRCMPAGGAILIHGGGNFGTLYPQHQRLRERVLIDFSDQRTIQLPQTINFGNQTDAVAETKRIIEEHGNFTLLVRDRYSHEFARNQFDCPVHLCPDMALMLGSIKSGYTAKFDYFLLARTDHEKALDWPAAFADESCHESGDWLAEWTWERVLTDKARSRRLRRVNGALAFAYKMLAQMRLWRGIRTLSQGHVVVTDRLHAHILCVLMRKPHVVLGDSHGKIGAFFETYSSQLSPAIWSTTPTEAFKAARLLLEAP